MQTDSLLYVLVLILQQHVYYRAQSEHEQRREGGAGAVHMAAAPGPV